MRTCGCRAIAASRSNLFQRAAAVLELATREQLQTQQQPAGVVAAVRFDRPHHHVHFLAHEVARHLKHAVGLSDAGREAEEDAQLGAALAFGFLRDALEQRVGIGTW
jgi:hypothetical protein